jgi:hypothetical protein
MTDFTDDPIIAMRDDYIGSQAHDNFIEARLDALVPEFERLIKACIADIADDYRSSIQDAGEDEPMMDLTIATDDDVSSWSFQTGDNSFTGGAYGFPHWAVLYLSRDTNPHEAAEDAANQLGELILG